MEEALKTVDTSLDTEDDSCSSSVSSDGDVGDNAKKNYRLASSFELGDEQPTGDASQSRKKEDDSFHKLFGPPSLIKTEKPVEVSDQVQKIKKTVTKKPLPVNPLTGDVAGMQPKKETVDNIQPTVPKVKSGRQPPGGHHSPLW
eukprot:TRINITY_DN6092_c0_g1_i1.p1 TRINITY_DN6092_c0_g1~~TRINITY_DN6092_c0_g1_i1.p1  ORF type:complete len:144 (+),score=43.98 TRINITY_DN6092_c0_g1_i1:40-471(+)